MLLLDLYWAFFCIGGLTFGGGYAMLSMLQYEIVEKRGWVTEEEMLDYFAIGQCTPGIIAVNTATFVGYKKRGVIGSIVATLGMITPALIIITVIATVLSNFQDNLTVHYALTGISIVVCAMIVNSVIKLVRTGVKRAIDIVFCIAAFVLAALLNVDPVFIVLGSIAIGIGMGLRRAEA